jgi:hypothetical protein
LRRPVTGNVNALQTSRIKEIEGHWQTAFATCQGLEKNIVDFNNQLALNMQTITKLKEELAVKDAKILELSTNFGLIFFIFKYISETENNGCNLKL